MNAPAITRSGGGPLREALALCGAHLRFAVLFSAIVNLAYLAPTLYMLQVYDRVVPSGSHPTLVFLTLALAATLFLLTYLDRMRSRLLLAAGARLNEVFTGRIFRSALAGAGQPLRLNQMVRDFDTIRAAISGPAALAVFDTPWTPIYIIVCFIVHPVIGALATGGAIILALLALLNERTTHDLDRQAAGAATAAAFGQEAISANADVIRSLGMSAAFQAQFEDARAAMVSPQLHGARTTGRIAGLIRFTRLLLQSIALGAGAWLAIDKQVSSGAIFASSMLAARALSPIDLVVANWRSLAAALASYDALKDHLRRVDTHPVTELPRPRSRLTVLGATVMAPSHGRALLEGVSFEAATGEVVGVIGPSGSGKSTLLQLIANARACDRGEIRLDGAQLVDWDGDRLGRFIGYMPQDAALFAGSIKDNISRFDRWRGVDAGTVDRQAVAAAMEAEIHELILGLPQGYDTVLGSRGRGLSAGQQQRIALARALYGDPVLYVFDEPNSSVDADGEAALLRLLPRLKAQGSIVVMAIHRASLVGAADMLVQLRAGRLERLGARDAVLAALQPPPKPALAAQVANKVD